MIHRGVERDKIADSDLAVGYGNSVISLISAYSRDRNAGAVLIYILGVTRAVKSRGSGSAVDIRKAEVFLRFRDDGVNAVDLSCDLALRCASRDPVSIEPVSLLIQPYRGIGHASEYAVSGTIQIAEEYQVPLQLFYGVARASPAQ
jgi:hypothetical protein